MMHLLLTCYLCLRTVSAIPAGKAREGELKIPDPSEFNYTIDHPFQIPAKPNGLDTKQPNIILFMPDQLRYDSVGIFGNDVCQ